MSRHARRRPLRTAMLALLAVLAAGAIAHSTLLLFLLLAAGAVLVWRRHARAHVMSSSPGRDRAEPTEATQLRAVLDQAQAECADLRHSITKLEDQAAEHDALVERLERITRRPVELHLADLERAQRLYGPAAIGKPGRRP